MIVCLENQVVLPLVCPPVGVAGCPGEHPPEGVEQVEQGVRHDHVVVDGN